MAEMRFERLMSDSDALMWGIEKDPLLRSTITSVSILEQSPDRLRFDAQLERASRAVPRLRQRVVSPPFGVGPPQYVVDPNFDISYHVRWQKAPGDGSLRALLDLAAPFAMQGFDRARPLWEFVVIEGLQDGKAALMQKMHHSLTDGVGAMKLSMAFLDTKANPTRDPGPMPPVPESERPSPWSLMREGVEHRNRRRLGMLRRAPGQTVKVLTDPAGTAQELGKVAGSAVRLLRPVSQPLSPIMGKRSLSVHFDTLTASLPAMKVAAKKVDGHLNDAFVAAVAGGLDRYHRAHGTPVDQLRMTMPINVRPAEGELVAGNQFVPARFAFPVSIADPADRMRALKELVTEQRTEPALRLMGGPIAGALNRLPVSLTTSLFGAMLKSIDVVTSNVPGAPIPIYIAGARVEANYGFGPMSGAASNITLLSYIDDLHLAVSTDPAAVPDPDLYTQCLQEGIDEIEKLS